jgi:hypothetical protein
MHMVSLRHCLTTWSGSSRCFNFWKINELIRHQCTSWIAMPFCPFYKRENKVVKQAYKLQFYTGIMCYNFRELIHWNKIKETPLFSRSERFLASSVFPHIMHSSTRLPPNLFTHVPTPVLLHTHSFNQSTRQPSFHSPSHSISKFSP